METGKSPETDATWTAFQLPLFCKHVLPGSLLLHGKCDQKMS